MKFILFSTIILSWAILHRAEHRLATEVADALRYEHVCLTDACLGCVEDCLDAAPEVKP